MTSEKFRRQLRQEALLWREEELIDDSVYQQLSKRYQFESIETAASNRFVMILIGLGGILLGLGVITFVAANWQQWPRELKTLLLLSLFIAVNTIGFYLWRSEPQASFFKGRKKRLGEGLLIFGALSLGANISLMAQMFHIGGSPYGLFLVWGLGVLAMSYSLRLVSLGVLSILLIAVGYWTGIPEIFSLGEYSWLEFLLEHMALIAGVLFVPLAYWCQSRVIFVMALLVLIPALEVNITPLLNANLGLGSAIALTLPPALLWGYDDSLFPKIHSRRFQPSARSLAIWFLCILFFYLSFQLFWQASSSNNFSELPTRSLFGLVDLVIFIGVAILEWLNLVKPSQLHTNRWGFDSVTRVIAGFLITTATVSFWHFNIFQIPVLATFIFNIQMFLLASGAIRIGLARGKRSAFWGGIVLLILQIMSRTLEYNTELLLKAFVFALCGVGVILAGLWFEKYLSHEQS